MKKILIVFGTLFVLSGGIFVARFLGTPSELTVNNNGELGVYGSANDTLGDNAEAKPLPSPFDSSKDIPKSPVKAPVKPMGVKYLGQALDFLGDPKILSSYPKAFVETKRNQLADVIKLIEGSPEEEVNWLDVGLIKKNFDNYIGARDVWEYAKALDPNGSMAYYNLGNLYAGYLRDNLKAEANFLQAVRLSPNESYMRLALAEFYRDFYKEKYSEQEGVLLDGLKAVPNEPNLILNLARYYESIKDVAHALEYFNRFLKLPGLSDLQVLQIKDEMGRL